jgi:CDP-glucose 4,6-dehydratase
MFRNAYENKRIVVTGHTGFKGSWLTLWLQSMGADVLGVSLPQTPETSHLSVLDLKLKSLELDIRNLSDLRKPLEAYQPDLIFHLAGQSIVSKGYANPLDTWTTNVIGTANLLELARSLDNLQGVVVATSDKVYLNDERGRPFSESDTLGGKDPYSASKAATEFVTMSFRESYLQDQQKIISSVRAGNVIGGGDWARDRLIPDFFRAKSAAKKLIIRNPHAIRPWQHVLDCLSGYLCVGEQILSGENGIGKAWNFGPSSSEFATVLDVVGKLGLSNLSVVERNQQDYPEAGHLVLDSSMAKTELNWLPTYSLEEAIKITREWYDNFLDKGEVLSRRQLQNYRDRAFELGRVWAI